MSPGLGHDQCSEYTRREERACKGTCTELFIDHSRVGQGTARASVLLRHEHPVPADFRGFLPYVLGAAHFGLVELQQCLLGALALHEVPRSGPEKLLLFS